MSQLLKVNPSPFAFDPMHAFLPSLELHSLRCPLSFLYFSIFLSHIDSFPSACKPTQCLSHPNESSLDLRSPGNLISFLMSLKLLQSSLYSSSPPAHLPPTPPSLQPDSTSSPLYRHSWEKIFYDFKFAIMVKINTGFLKFLSSFEMPAPSVPATGDITRFLYTCDRKSNQTSTVLFIITFLFRVSLDWQI